MKSSIMQYVSNTGGKKPPRPSDRVELQLIKILALFTADILSEVRKAQVLLITITMASFCLCSSARVSYDGEPTCTRPGP